MNKALRVDDLLDRVNPVFVAEVRRALRGKAFMVAFLVMQAIVAFVAVAWGTTTSDPDGRDLLRVLLSVLSFSAYVYVPIVAFQSMAGEVERESLDHLLAPLRPWRVVLGKWLSSMTLLALLASAFAPFACLALLAGGVDPRYSAGELGHILVYSAAATMVALWFGVLAPNRTARTLLLVLLFVVLLMGDTVWQVFIARVAGPSSILGIGWRLAPMIVFAFLGLGAFLAACARIAHPHENKSTPLRLWGTAGVALAGFAWRGGGGDLVAAFFVLVLLWGMGVVFASEPDGDLRWFRNRIPRSRPLALLALPWLPGGAFAGPWILLHATGLWFVCGLGWGESRVILVLSLLTWSLAILPTSLIPVIRSGVTTRFVRTFSLLLPFFLAAVADAFFALIGVQGEGLLERVFDLDLRDLGEDLGVFGVLFATFGFIFGLGRLLPELRLLERLRRGERDHRRSRW